MANIYNIYCDESCHLETDHKPIMAISAVWCPLEKTKEISKQIREIKSRNGLSKNFEIKWTKVSPAKLNFYLELVDYFFSEPDLHFKTVIIQKNRLDHKHFDQTHDDWYYKMVYQLLARLIEPERRYRIYIDIKDTQSEKKRSKLQEFLKNKFLDQTGDKIERVQQICSRESSIIQIADFLMGAVRYHNEKISTSNAKQEIIKRIISHSRYSLLETTPLKELKFNIFHWKGKEKK